MKTLPKIIDNNRHSLKDVLIETSKHFNELSIATGYWDLEGMKLILPEIKNYSKIRLLIGQEPLIPRYKNKLNIQNPEPDFPDQDIKFDLTTLKPNTELTDIVSEIEKMIQSGNLEVRIYRKTFLHAKCYIFGSYTSDSAIGIIGSSNFTRNGLTKNTELNALESDHRIVLSEPKTQSQEVGHLFWFDQFWNEETTEIWSGEFSEILTLSTVGPICYSPYEMYMATLWNLYQTEITTEITLTNDIAGNLYAFQQRNAQLLINKIDLRGLAMLADSVGLGKTITAGAVIKHYLKQGFKRIYVIAPARLIPQWKDDLADKHELYSGFDIISMQDLNRIEEEMSRDKYYNVDLFIIDEAHNLRNDSSTRHQKILEWLSNNPNSKVLLLTATPVNNQLTDFVNQIQLASKGKLDSFPVIYSTPNKKEVIDFYDAVKRLASYIKEQEKNDKEPDWERVNKVMRQGLKHFLVRSTRSGILKDFNGGLLGNDGVMRTFPTSNVKPAEYSFSEINNENISKQIASKIKSHFENLDPRNINIDSLVKLTQRTEHPFDSIQSGIIDSVTTQTGVFTNLFQIVLTLGFAPYKSKVYEHRFYSKSLEQILEYKLNPKESMLLMSQIGIHNILRVSFLKRLESSPYALKKSIENYIQRLEQFTGWLNKGYILSFNDINEITKEYGEDIAEIPYEATEDKIVADPKIYDLLALRKDLERDQKIASVLVDLCNLMEESDDKLDKFIKLIHDVRTNNESKKVLVFSFYADTIEYLKNKLPKYLTESEINESAFVTGANALEMKELTGRFSPQSKNFTLSKEHPEINYLFATDVLSEGQNLQDCPVLINFDLHWNPVRMIQRNGRINRLGSKFKEVYIYNMAPEKQLESYLKLIKRLRQKINRIKHTIGTDQSVLGEEENPIEYIDQIEEEGDSDKTKNLYDPVKASQALIDLEDDNDFLSEDEHVFELRAFLKNASEKEIEVIKNIALGKWGYLPNSVRNIKDVPEVIGLTRTILKEDTSQKTYQVDIFVEYRTKDGKVDVVDTIEALNHLKTTPDEIKRLRDNIKLDKERSFIKKLMEKQAVKEATNETTVFKRTRVISYILDQVSYLRPDLQLSRALDCINSKLEHKETTKLFTDANNDMKTYDQLRPATLERFTRLVEELTKEKKPDKTVDEVNTILFYAK